MSNATIVIVEDEAVIALDMQDILEQQGYRVVAVVSTAGAALAAITRHQPDLVLLDIHLADGSSGITVAEEVYTRWQIPVIFLTAHSDDATISRAQATAPYHYLLKPFNEREIGIAVELALARSATERQLRASERRFATTIASIGDGVVVADVHSRVTLLNPVAERLTGCATSTAIGQPVYDVAPLLDEETHTPIEDMLSLVRAGITRLDAPTLLRSRDGTLWPVDVNASPMVDDLGSLTGVVIVVREVSARRRAEAEQRQRTFELMVLSNLGKTLQRCSNLPEAYAAVATAAFRLFPHDDGTLYARRVETNSIEAVAHWGDPQPLNAPLGETVCRAIKQQLVYQFAANAEAHCCALTSDAQARTTICAPLVAQGESFGVLQLRLADPDRNIASGLSTAALDARRELAVMLAEQAALGLANIQLWDTLREQAIRDPLTGLFNRRYMEEAIEREPRFTARPDYPIGVIMLDIDHFKTINDTYGHAAGDAVLRRVGRLLLTSVRAEDIVCRYGGEEFVLVLPRAPVEVARARAEQIRAHVSEIYIEHNGRPLPPITISAGVALVPHHAPSVGEALRVADWALYQAKRNGRNQVRFV